MATYYVNPDTGSDTTGDGSSGNPWATIVHALTGARMSGGDGLVIRESITEVVGGYCNVATGTGGPVTISALNDATITLSTGISSYWLTVDADTGLIFDESTTLIHSVAAPCFWMSTGREVEFNGTFRATVSTAFAYIVQANVVMSFNGANLTRDTTGYMARQNGGGASGGQVLFTNCEIDVAKLVSETAGAGLSTVVDGCNFTGPIDSLVATTSANAQTKIKNSTFQIDSTEATSARLLYLADWTNYDQNLMERNRFWFTDEPSAPTSAAFNELLNHPVMSWDNFFLDPASDQWSEAATGTPLFDKNQGVICAFGDSITVGSGATTTAQRWANVFSGLAGVTCTVDNKTAIGGMSPGGCLLNIDRGMAEYGPSQAFVLIGNNQSSTLLDATITPTEYANGLICCLEKLKNYGVEPIWLGMSHLPTGGLCTRAQATERVLSANAAVEAWCSNNGVVYRNIAQTMVSARPSDWDTYYYERNGVVGIEDDVHPNDYGHALIAQQALYAWLDTRPMVRPCVVRPVEVRPCVVRPVRVRG